MAELVSQPQSIQSIYTWFREDRLYVNRRYQRKLVWTLEEKQKLIESILNKYPIPAILIAERDEQPGTYEIIDGLQRLHAIVAFIETTFPTLEGAVFDLESFPTAKSFSELGYFEPTESHPKLSQKNVSTILDYTLTFSIMRNATEAEVNDVFDRINTYGHRLSDQERRQAGVQNEFSNLVREIACELRGDVSDEVLTLSDMPSISVDLPMTKHGYEVRADEVFWVTQGILRSTDLRDSMDEQCIADIAACIIGADLIPRTKDALDAIYIEGSSECERLKDALKIHGADRFSEEFKFCVDEIAKVCNAVQDEKLRDIIFQKRTTNAFPSVFALILIAFHELHLRDKKKITSYTEVRRRLENLVDRIDSGRRAGGAGERRKNIDTIKGLISAHFVEAKDLSYIYSNHSIVDIEGVIRRSEIELSTYELKQGILTLDNKRNVDDQALDKILKTISAIANNGNVRAGKILIGVTDSDSDAARIKNLDGIDPKIIGKRKVVGVNREAMALNISTEQYFSKYRDAIEGSPLSDPLKKSVLSSLDYHDFYGLGLIMITIPCQRDVSYYGDQVFWRKSDATVRAEKPEEIVTISNRFK